MDRVSNGLKGPFVLFPDEVLLFHQIKEMKCQLEIETVGFAATFLRPRGFLLPPGSIPAGKTCSGFLLFLEGKGKMLNIDHLEETGEGEIVCQNLINLFRKGGGGFVCGFPFGQERWESGQRSEH